MSDQETPDMTDDPATTDTATVDDALLPRGPVALEDEPAEGSASDEADAARDESEAIGETPDAPRADARGSH